MQQSSPWLLQFRVRQGRQTTFKDVPLLFFAEKISEMSLLKMLDHDKHPYDDILKSEVCPPAFAGWDPSQTQKRPALASL